QCRRSGTRPGTGRWTSRRTRRGSPTASLRGWQGGPSRAALRGRARASYAASIGPPVDPTMHGCRRCGWGAWGSCRRRRISQGLLVRELARVVRQGVPDEEPAHLLGAELRSVDDVVEADPGLVLRRQRAQREFQRLPVLVQDLGEHDGAVGGPVLRHVGEYLGYDLGDGLLSHGPS